MGRAFLATRGVPGNLVFDLDGVIFLGAETIPGAPEALLAVESTGALVSFATNNATKTTEQIADRISSALGYSVRPGAIATSATATAAFLDGACDPVLTVGEAGLAATLEGAGRRLTQNPLEAASVVVGLDRAISYEKIDRAASAVRQGARFVATNTDATFPTPRGPVPGAGSIAAAIGTAAGCHPEVVGKPHPPMVRHLRSVIGPGPTWMIGDRPETDLALARAAGWFSVLTLTGVTSEPSAIARHLMPDLVIESIADLTEVFA